MKESPPKPALSIRHCACRCGKSWKAVATSPNQFWNEAHAQAALLEPKGSEARTCADEHFQAKPVRGNGWNKNRGTTIHNATPAFADERTETAAAVEPVKNMRDEGFEF